MDDAKGQVTSSAADVYEAFFVPALFAEWAPRVADAASPAPGATAVDVACGTGVLARELAARLGPAAVSALDRNDGMLAVARAREPEIDWRLGRAESLPYDDARFDAVVSQFGLMFFDDREAALAEMWRVLRPGGTLAVAVFGALDDAPGYASMVALLDRLFGEAIANELRAPYSLGDVTALRALFDRAGVPVDGVDTVAGRARFPSLADWVHTDVRGWTLADKITDAQFELLAREAEQALLAHVTDDGAVDFAHPAHIVTATKR